MASDWPFVTLEEASDPESKAFTMGPFGSKIRSSNYVASGVPVLRGGNLNGERFSDEGYAFLTEEKAQELAGSWALPGDIVLAAQGSVGSVGLVPTSTGYEKFVLSQNLMRARVDTTRASAMFVFYWFRSPAGQHEILSYVNPTGVPCVSRPLTSLRSFRIPLPPLDEQRRIAAVLGALDDKIELNRKMNRTLEEMAQAIFKSWFIDFDGVPDSELVESELGPIPRGWTPGKLGAVAKQHRVTVNPEEQEPDTPYIGLADMPQGSIALAEWGHASDATSAKATFAEGDILFGKLRPYFKKVGVAPCDGVCSSDIIVARPKVRHWYGYLLGLLTLDAFIDFTTAVSTGTRMPRVPWKAMAGYDIAVPPKELAERFDGLVRPVVRRIKANIWQSRTLAGLRDALLPKLISGEIRVPEAEEAVEAVL